MLIALALGVLALACLALGHFRPGYQRVTTVLLLPSLYAYYLDNIL
jgi:hypothetical protein